MTRASRAARARVAAGFFVLFLLVLLTIPGAEYDAGNRGAPDLSAYTGLGIWVDIFDEQSFRNPERAVREMDENGVHTLYLQTGNYSRDADVYDVEAAGEFIDAAHDRGIEVVAWYLPGFRNLDEDLRRVMSAVRFRSSGGDAFDSFGLDIEGTLVNPVSLRNERLLRLSKRIRNAVGGSYPLGAIIPSPEGLERSTYWPEFPYAELARIYDVMVVMGYYTYHGNGPQLVRADVAENIAILRERIAGSSTLIHLIGGLAGRSSAAETRAFAEAARAQDLLGASLYDFSTTDAEDWAALRELTGN
ncbi:MAG: hypothetical protein WD276_07795 [Actinomycetota bacterium]